MYCLINKLLINILLLIYKYSIIIIGKYLNYYHGT